MLKECFSGSSLVRLGYRHGGSYLGPIRMATYGRYRQQ